MKNLNLRKRILLGYLAPMLLMMAVCGMVVRATQTLSSASEFVELAHEIMDNIKDIHVDSQAMLKSVRGYILARNETSRQSYDQALADYRVKLEMLGKQIRDPEQREALSNLAALTEQQIEIANREFQLVDAGQVSKAIEMFKTGKAFEVSRKIDKLIDETEHRHARILLQRQEEENRVIDSLMSMVLVSTGLAVILALVFSWWIANKISKSIVEAVAGMSTSSAEIAATVDEHERVVTQQAAAVNETTSTVEELSVSSSQSASQAESAAAAAKEALGVSQDGIRLANEVSSSMTDMKQKVGSVAEQILRLSEQAGQIGGIARVVGELAGETNMLALNAAVEAARAGENGKGFAVVAAEIRKLAEQSKKSAERANALVAEIQKATNSAVMVTEEGSRTAEQVAVVVDKAIAAFGFISDNANSVSISAQQVLLNSRQQANALGQVTEAMKSLAAGSAQMAAGTEQTKNGIQKLNSVAQGLQAMV